MAKGFKVKAAKPAAPKDDFLSLIHISEPTRPLRTIKFFLALIVFIVCVAYEFVPENTQKNLGGQNTHQRSY